MIFVLQAMFHNLIYRIYGVQEKPYEFCSMSYFLRVVFYELYLLDMFYELCSMKYV